jgi:hypothetical protein
MKTKNTIIFISIILIIAVLGAGFWIYRNNSEKTQTVSIKSTTYPWEKSVDEVYNNAKQVEPDKNTKALADELSPIIKDTVKNDIKLTEGTDKKLVFVLKTIVVEGDVDNIKKSLENKGYKEAVVSDQHKKLTAKKDDRIITFAFSVDTTNQGKIEVSISS